MVNYIDFNNYLTKWLILDSKHSFKDVVSLFFTIQLSYIANILSYKSTFVRISISILYFIINYNPFTIQFVLVPVQYFFCPNFHPLYYIILICLLSTATLGCDSFSDFSYF